MMKRDIILVCTLSHEWAIYEFSFLLIFARGKVWVKSLKMLYQGGHWKRGAEE